MSVVKIQMQDGNGNVIHPQTNSDLVQYKENSVKQTLVELEDRDRVFIQQEEPAEDGLWIDTQEDVQEGSSESIVAKQIKKYIDENVTTKVDKVVKTVDECKVLSEKNKEDILSLSNQNLIFNGGFKVNQRNLSQYTENYKYSVDRWLLINYDDTTSSSKGVLNTTKEGVELKGMMGRQLYIQQIFDEELAKPLSGKYITLSLDVRVENMTQGNVFIQLGTRNVVGEETVDRNEKIFFDKSELSNKWKRITLTVLMPENLNRLSIMTGSFNNEEDGYFPVNTGCSMFFKDVKLELGKIATPFIPRSYGEELNLCKRYYEYIGEDVTIYGFTCSNNSEGSWATLKYDSKRVVPTITFGNIGAGGDNMGYIVSQGGILYGQNSISVIMKGISECRFKPSDEIFSRIGQNKSFLIAGYYKLDSEIY